MDGQQLYGMQHAPGICTELEEARGGEWSRNGGSGVVQSVER